MEPSWRKWVTEGRAFRLYSPSHFLFMLCFLSVPSVCTQPVAPAAACASLTMMGCVPVELWARIRLTLLSCSDSGIQPSDRKEMKIYFFGQNRAADQVPWARKAGMLEKGLGDLVLPGGGVLGENEVLLRVPGPLAACSPLSC